MKDLFAPLLTASWLTGLLPDWTFLGVKKTPWYRRSWIMTARWVPAVLVAPLAVFLVWKGIGRLRSRAAAS